MVVRAMYVVIVYDVEQSRVAKVCQYLRRWLHWVQNSAFEGELTESQLERIKQELPGLIDPERDSVYIYRLPDRKFVKREVIGRRKRRWRLSYEGSRDFPGRRPGMGSLGTIWSCSKALPITS
jgi:CRISPR-associated protein Cas2